MNDLFAKRGELQPYGRALLALALKDARRQRARRWRLRSKARRERATVRRALGVAAPADARLLRTRTTTEATALSFKALARISPQSPLLPKAARWLVANRRERLLLGVDQADGVRDLGPDRLSEGEQGAFARLLGGGLSERRACLDEEGVGSGCGRCANFRHRAQGRTDCPRKSVLELVKTGRVRFTFLQLSITSPGKRTACAEGVIELQVLRRESPRLRVVE